LVGGRDWLCTRRRVEKTIGTAHVGVQREQIENGTDPPLLSTSSMGDLIGASEYRSHSQLATGVRDCDRGCRCSRWTRLAVRPALGGKTKKKKMKSIQAGDENEAKANKPKRSAARPLLWRKPQCLRPPKNSSTRVTGL
jgi:hypothetical protein